MGFVGTTVTVRLGNGDGTFQPGQDFEAGFHPIDVTVGDFDRDGRQDLAVANSGRGSDPNIASIAILRGRENGAFDAPQHYRGPGAPHSVTVGDFNADGIQDLAAVDSGAFGDTMHTFIGDGSGTFRAGDVFGTVPNPSSVKVGDFNRDGRQDLASCGGGAVAITLGRGDGRFITAPEYRFGTTPSSIITSDFNRDGHEDLAVADNTTPSSVGILIGDGSGAFQAARNFAVRGGSLAITAGDFNGDSNPDVAVVGSYDNVSVLIGNGDGTFQPFRNFRSGGGGNGIVVSDFNRDGRQDLATANQFDDDVSVLLGRGDGTFEEPRRFGVGEDPRFVTAADFNGDSIPDLAASDFGSGCCSTVTILIGRGDGTFQETQRAIVGRDAVSIAAGDFNGDGRQDLATANRGAGNISVLIGNGDGTFQTARNLNFGVSDFVIALDINGDAVQDLAATGGNGVAILLGRGDGTFVAPPPFLSGVRRNCRWITVGDFNEDGRLDLATADNFAPSVSVLINDTPATLAPTVRITSPVDGAIFSVPATATISAEATASAGRQIERVEFYVGETLIGVATSAPYQITGSTDVPGTYVLRARAIDNLGASAVSELVTVTVR